MVSKLIDAENSANLDKQISMLPSSIGNVTEERFQHTSKPENLATLALAKNNKPHGYVRS